MKIVQFSVVMGLSLSMACRTDGASVPAFDFSTATIIFEEFILNGTNGMYGWSFTLSQPVTITGIGWYDKGGDGLALSHQVGIWTGAPLLPETNLLQQLTIQSGTRERLDGLYRLADLPTELTLEVGHYTVAGTYADGDPVLFVNARPGFPVERDWRVSPDFPVFARGGGFRTPDDGLLSIGLEVGPMLYIVQVPEPFPLPILGLGGLCLWCWRARTRR